MADDPRYSVKLDVSVGRDRSGSAPLPDDPFRICLIGDFRARRGAATEGPQPLSNRQPVTVDRDDLDDVLARFAPRLSLDIGQDATVELSFAELEHFHPDRVFERAPFFRALREARARLASPDGFQGALDAILGGPLETPGETSDVRATDVIADTVSDSLLDRVVGGETAHDSMRAFLTRIVSPHVVPGEDPQREAMLEDLDASVTRGVLAILHHPAFQALESLWRSVFFLVRRLETGPSLKVSLLDATIDELRAEGAVESLSQALDVGSSVLLVDHAFGAGTEDLELLETLAGLAVAKGAALLAGASPDLLGLETLSRLLEPPGAGMGPAGGWPAFRRSRGAGAIGLVLPRFLLRVPYGAESDPCDHLPLEEMDSPPLHRHFLWANGAVAVAALLGESFVASGWRMTPGRHLELAGLPMYSWRGPDGPGLTPCTESRISDDLVGLILEAGPMVLTATGHGDAARLVRVQSMASPPGPLKGPWSQMA